MLRASIAVASTRSSAPTSASMSGRSRALPDCAIASSTGDPARLRLARYRSTGGGTMLAIAVILVPGAPHEDHRHGGARKRQRRRPRRAHRRGHRHLPAELLPRYARDAGGDVPADSRGSAARAPRGGGAAGFERTEDPDRAARRRTRVRGETG